MYKKRSKEITIDVHWGKIVFLTWGDPRSPPVILIHGYMDSAATFLPLMELLPDDFYYVAIDFPGHGKSSRFPPGPVLSILHMVEPLRLVLEHLKIDKFICLLHSAGFLTATTFNASLPGRITKMICIDIRLGLYSCYYSHFYPKEVLALFYNVYYERYDSYYREPKTVPYNVAVSMVAKARKLPEEHAKLVLSRNVELLQNGLCRLTWDPRGKIFSGIIREEKDQIAIFTSPVPYLFIHASKQTEIGPSEADDYTRRIIMLIQQKLSYYKEFTVEGGHDVHLTNPERLAGYISDFLYDRKKCKI